MNNLKAKVINIDVNLVKIDVNYIIKALKNYYILIFHVKNALKA